jgi:hypothetical protein
MLITIASITLLGLLLNFSGAIILAKNAITSRQKILNISRQNIPVINSEEKGIKGRDQAYDDAILRMPDKQYRLLQSKNAKIGLILIVIGFSLQIPGVVLALIQACIN